MRNYRITEALGLSPLATIGMQEPQFVIIAT
jgi:hypothetical protein